MKKFLTWLFVLGIFIRFDTGGGWYTYLNSDYIISVRENLRDGETNKSTECDILYDTGNGPRSIHIKESIDRIAEKLMHVGIVK